MANDDVLWVSDLLVFGGAALLVGRVVLFGRALKALPTEQQQRHKVEGRLPNWRGLFSFAALALLIFGPGAPVRIGAMAWYVVQTLADAVATDRLLADHNFDAAFRRAQKRQSLLAAFAGLLIGSGVILPALLAS